MKRLPLALLVPALCLAACRTWQPITFSPRQLVEEAQPERLRVLQADGTQMDISNPRVERDSITAVVRGRRLLPAGSAGVGSRSVSYEDTVRIALANVTGVSTRQLSIGRTLALVLTPPAAFLVLVILYCGNQQCH
jgi:hypothetical protein